MKSIRIREIQKQDNGQMAAIVRDVLMDFGAPKVGTAYADPYLDTLFEVYDVPRAIYFVVESNGKILGGAGIMLKRPFVNFKKCTFCLRLEG